jgi:outer membrane protein assembly factor BamD (BamD/ComL family)
MTRPRTSAGTATRRIVVAVLAVLATACDVDAGTIGFRVNAAVTTGSGVRVTVELSNTGDEAAVAVVPTVVLGALEVAGASAPKLQPGSTQKWDIEVQREDLSPGSYVAVTKVAYEDANGYPFEVLAATPFDVDARRRPSTAGTLALPTLAPGATATGTFTLRANENRVREFRLDLVTPRSIRVTRHSPTVTVDSSGTAKIDVEFRNQGLLAGNTSAIFALVTGIGEVPPQTDLIRAVVRAGTTADALRTNDFITTLVVLAVGLFVLELIAGRGRSGPLMDPTVIGARLTGFALALATSAFLVLHYPWDVLLADTITAGGDMASLFYPTKLVAEEILPRWELTGWTMGNYAGFPVLHFYSTLPFAVIALLGHVAPMTIVFKLVTLLGPTLLPLSAALLFRWLGYGPGVPAIAAASLVPFLLQQGNSMWGGNIPSVLAGEFCHAIGLSLSLIFVGQLHRVVRGSGSWPLAAGLLAIIGLCHTFAFFAAVWYSLYFLRPHARLSASAPPILAIFAVAFLLLCVWGLPLPGRLVFTSEWSMIWHIKDWKEVLPSPLWPAGILAGLNCLVTLVRIKPFSVDRMGLLAFNVAGGVLLYFLVPAIGFPDIRFVPVGQVFLSLLAADMLGWLGTRSRNPHLFAACLVTAALAWGHSHLGYIPSWLKWNYSGYEGKPTWQLFKAINDHVAGDFNDPRVMFEHSELHNRFGSSRAFENLPLFSGRATLEGVFHQASQSSPFIFYLQSEASERTSGPFPQYTYARLNPDKALPHMRLFNVGAIVVATDKAKAAYDAHPEFERTFTSGAYAVFRVRDLDSRYVIPVANEPVLYSGADWKLAFYRWFKHSELLDIPLVPASLLRQADAREFRLRTDTIARLPKQPVTGPCEVASHLENYKITFETTCPQTPHIVKVSYFPRWSGGDTARVFPVSPGFMLVFPNQPRVEITYRRTAVDWVALTLTCVGLGLLLATLASRQLRGAMPVAMRNFSLPVLRWIEKHRAITTVVVVAAMVFVGTSTRLALRAPDRAYQKAQEAYHRRDFPEAIRRLEEWTRRDKDTFKQATALHQLGICYNETDQPAAAAEVLERLRFEFPNVDYGAATLYHLVKAWEALGDTDRARSYALLLAVDHPDSPYDKRIDREWPTLRTR